MKYPLKLITRPLAKRKHRQSSHLEFANLSLPLEVPTVTQTTKRAKLHTIDEGLADSMIDASTKIQQFKGSRHEVSICAISKRVHIFENLPRNGLLHYLDALDQNLGNASYTVQDTESGKIIRWRQTNGKIMTYK
jgi:hypothetical protein